MIKKVLNLSRDELVEIIEDNLSITLEKDSIKLSSKGI